MLESLAYLHHCCAYEEDEPVELNLEPAVSGIGLSLAVLASFANLQSTQAVPVLQQGDQGESVKGLNQRLQAAGCLPPRLVQLRYNEYTSAAVKSLQRQNGLDMSGTVAGSTADLIEAGEECNAVADAGALKFADKSQDVAMLRQQLKNWGFPLAGQELLAVTNEFDLDTEDALKEFEEFFGLKQDGMLDVLDSKILWGNRYTELLFLFQDIAATETNVTARITPFLNSDNAADQRSAATALGRMGADAKEAVPQLVPLLDSQDASGEAARAIGQIGGTEAVPDLITQLNSENEAVRRQVARALGAIGTEARDAVPNLIEIAKSSSTGEERKDAVQALGQIGSEAEAAVPELLSLIDSEDAVSPSALDAIGQIGGPEATSELTTMLESQDVTTRTSAARALGNIGADAKDAVPALIELLKSPNVEDRFYAAVALGNMGSAAEEAVPDIIPLLRDSSLVTQTHKDSEINRVDYSAINALSQMGPAAEVAIPELVTKVSDPENPNNISKLAAGALLTIDPSHNALLSSLGSETVRARANSAFALGLTSPTNPDQKVVDGLLRRVEDQTEDLNVRTKAAISLLLLGQNKQQFFSATGQNDIYNRWMECPVHPLEVMRFEETDKAAVSEKPFFFDSQYLTCAGTGRGGDPIVIVDTIIKNPQPQPQPQPQQTE